MQARTFQAVLASLAILASALLAYVLVPREMMAKSAETFDIRTIIPPTFGEWTLAPNVKLVEPEPDSFSRLLYSQEVGYGFKDREGHVVMLLIAYGPNQSSRLQLHRPELCYTASGFRISPTVTSEVGVRQDLAPLKLLRLTAQREARNEPISYWMRVGDSVATSVVERNLIRLRLVMHGKVADGALIRVSTVGLPEQQAYPIHDRFIRDMLNAVAPENLSFFIGDGPPNPKVAKATDVQ